MVSYVSHLLVFFSGLHSFCFSPLAWGMSCSFPCNIVQLVMNFLSFFNLKCLTSSWVLKDKFPDHRILTDIFFSFIILKIWFICIEFALFGFWPSFFLMRSQSSFLSFLLLCYMLFFSNWLHDFLLIFGFTPCFRLTLFLSWDSLRFFGGTPNLGRF